MAVQPDTASALVDVIFMLGRTIRTTMSHMEDEILPTALIGVLFLLRRTGECRPSELGEFNRSMQHRATAGSVAARRRPRPGFASRGPCVACC